MLKDRIRIVAATPTIKVADCNHNADRIIELMKKARSQGAHLLVLPELCITGATCGDLFLHQTLIKAAGNALDKIVSASRGSDMLIVAGMPLWTAKELMNVAAVFSNGRLLGFVPKVYRSNRWKRTSKYFSFEAETESDTYEDKSDYFYVVDWNGSHIPLGENLTFQCGGAKVGVEVGGGLEPIQPLYSNATIIAQPSATHSEIGSTFEYPALLERLSGEFAKTYAMASAGWGESTTDMVYSGHNIISAYGVILHESPPFCEGYAIADISLRKLKDFTPSPPPDLPPPSPFTLAENEQLPFVKMCQDPNEAIDIQAAGLAGRMFNANIKTAVIGISGGLDSTMALLATVRAFKMLDKPLSDIITLTMPCFGTTEHTKNNAHALCQALGIKCREIDITNSVALHLKDIGHANGVFDVVFENAQARMRTMVLMDIANQTSGLVVGTGSLSELALGWATYNGDHMSMYAVNSSVPKTLVRHLVKHTAKTTENEQLKKVLESILATKVSPELLPTPQHTEDLVGPYELHDFFLFHMLFLEYEAIEILKTALDVFNGKYSREEIVHWLKIFLRRFFSQQFKRNCLPDGPKVVCVSLSPRVGLAMPSDASAAAWLQEIEAFENL